MRGHRTQGMHARRCRARRSPSAVTPSTHPPRSIWLRLAMRFWSTYHRWACRPGPLRPLCASTRLGGPFAAEPDDRARRSDGLCQDPIELEPDPVWIDLIAEVLREFG